MAYPADTRRESKCFRQNGKVLVFVSGVVALEMGGVCVVSQTTGTQVEDRDLRWGLARVIPRLV